VRVCVCGCVLFVQPSITKRLELEARRRSPARRAPPRQGQVRRLYMQTHRNTLQRTARCNAAVQSHIKEGLLLKKAELDEEYVHTKKYMYREIYIRDTLQHSVSLCNTTLQQRDTYKKSSKKRVYKKGPDEECTCREISQYRFLFI